MSVVERLLQKARQALRRAEGMRAIADDEAARREAYFAAFHAARALLFEKTNSLPRTHKGVSHMFGQYAVSHGFAPDLARFLGRGFQYKKLADYEVAEYEPDVSAATAMAVAERFIDAVEAALKTD